MSTRHFGELRQNAGAASRAYRKQLKRAAWFGSTKNICTGAILLAKAFGHCSRSPYAPDIFSAMYSKSFRRTRSGKWSVASMRLIVMAVNPEVLCVPRTTVQAVLRDKPRT